MKEELDKLFGPYIVSRRIISGQKQRGYDDADTVGSNKAAELVGMSISAFQSALQSGRVQGAYREQRHSGRPAWVIPVPVIVDPPRRRSRWTKPGI